MERKRFSAYKSDGETSTSNSIVVRHSARSSREGLTSAEEVNTHTGNEAVSCSCRDLAKALGVQGHGCSYMYFGILTAMNDFYFDIASLDALI